MIVLDNSEYMRNGDYQPTRFGALADAVTTVFQTKIDSNPENTVGVMTMANKGYARSISSSPTPSHYHTPILTIFQFTRTVLSGQKCSSHTPKN